MQWEWRDSNPDCDCIARAVCAHRACDAFAMQAFWPHLSGGFSSRDSSNVGQSKIDGFTGADDGLSRFSHVRTVRTNTEINKKNAHNAHKKVATHAQCQHTAPTNEDAPMSTTAGYANGKRRTNLSLHAKQVDLMQESLRKTRGISLSRFVEEEILKWLRRNANTLRKKGVKLPAEIFA